MSIELVMPSNHLILCRPLLLLPSIFHSSRVFSNESALRIRWPKYWNFSFSISPSHEHPGLISFRMDWLDLLTVQGFVQICPLSILRTCSSSQTELSTIKHQFPVLPSLQLLAATTLLSVSMNLMTVGTSWGFPCGSAG